MSTPDNSKSPAPNSPSDNLPAGWHPVGSANYNVEPGNNKSDDVPAGQYLPPSQ